METLKTIFGGKKLIFNGYVYIKDRHSNEATYWRCEKRGICNARMTTFRLDESVKKHPSSHNHPTDLSSVEAARTIEEIKSRAILTDETTSSVINKCTESISITTAVKLPSKESLSKIVRRKRKATELDFFDSVHTTRGQNFLISNNPELDLIILGTEDNIAVLNRYRDWFCDGTFDSAPIGFQLYTIHALVSETVTIPLIFCIARQKNEITYREIFSSIKEFNVTLNPRSIMLDFERAAINAMAQHFPAAELQGCYFHFGQAIWRHIQSFGLQQRYQNEEEFAVIVKQFQALGFVPPIDVVPCYEELIDSLSDQLIADLSDFLQYFEKTWIGIEHHGRRRHPLFDVELWNVRDRVERSLPRTSNSVEGWHRAFDQRVNMTHPTTSKLIRKIVVEQSSNEITLEKVRCGHELSKPRKKYAQINKRIEKLVHQYIYMPHIDFLRGMSLNLSL